MIFIFKKIKACLLRKLHDLFGFKFVADNIRVLHHSSNYLVVDKHYDLLINSNDKQKVTVESQLRLLFPNLAKNELVHGFHFAHRLDFSTSGVLCLAKNKAAAAIACEVFANRKTSKYYIALVRGIVSHELMTIDMPIGIDSRPEVADCNRMCTSEKPYCLKPKSASTRLLVLQKGLYDDYPATKIMLKPVTGRRHQLRVHCSSIGHTIIGDYTYSNRKDILPPRMFLHSHRLILPTEIETIDVSARDIFNNDDNNCRWRPVVTFNNIDKGTYEKIDSQSPDIVVHFSSGLEHLLSNSLG